MLFILNVFYFSTLILFQGHQSEARGPVCLQCDQVAQPSDCKNIKLCGDQELCVMQKYVTNDGAVWFDVGCSSSKHCSSITSVLGKRNYDVGVLPTLRRNAIQNISSSNIRSAGDTIVCDKCCFGDLCNAGSMCGTVGFLHEMVCLNCVTTNAVGCNTIELCDKDQKCFIEKVGNSSTSNIAWKTGCRHKDVCQQLQSSPGTECLSSCCSSDLCNSKCSNDNRDALCVDKSVTCSNKTFQSFVCSQSKLQDTCPRSCGLCHCTPNPCIHGTCISSRQGYKCSCDAGFTGSICDKVIDYCSPNPCVHGFCYNSPHGYNCSCFSVYTGSTCSAISPCMSAPCIHGTCHISQNGYKCTCDYGYTGSTCDTETGVNQTGLFHLFNRHLWKWTDCSNPATRAITVSHFDFSPKPLRIPGNITTAYDITIHRRIGINSHLRLNVTMDKKLIGHWHNVPCRYHVGTCVYDDPCDFFYTYYVSHTCPQAIVDLGLTCGCPINPVHLVRSPLSAVGSSSSGFWLTDPITDILSGRFEVKVIPSAYSFIAAGDFRIKIELLELNKTIGCLAVEWSIVMPCHGFLCGR